MKKYIVALMFVSSLAFATDYSCELNNSQRTGDGWSQNEAVVVATVSVVGQDKAPKPVSAVLPNGKTVTVRIQNGLYGSGTTSFELMISGAGSLKPYFISIVEGLPSEARLIAGDDDIAVADAYEMTCKKK